MSLAAFATIHHNSSKEENRKIEYPNASHVHPAHLFFNHNPTNGPLGNAFAALAAILKTAKRTWHGRSEAKAHGSLPMKNHLPLPLNSQIPNNQ
jgi:hypothetical protein